MISISELATCVHVEWAAKNSVMIWGSPGIGKSAVVKKICATSSYFVPADDELAEHSKLVAGVVGKRHLGRPMFDVRLSLMSPTDIKGIPVFDSSAGDAVWIMSGIFPMDPSKLAELRIKLLAMGPDGRAFTSLEKKYVAGLRAQHGVVFLDELTQAPASVQVSAFGLVLDRRVNDYTVPASVDLIAASNKMTDKSGSNKMPAALYSRFSHFSVDCPTVDSWVTDFAEPAGVELDIMAFLKGNPALFYTFDSRNQTEDGSAGAYACPRTWEFLDRKLKVVKSHQSAADDVPADIAAMLALIPKDSSVASLASKSQPGVEAVFDALVEASLGPGVAMAFVGWLKAYRTMPPMEDYLEGRVTIEQMVEPINAGGRVDVGLVYAMTNNILTCLKTRHNEARMTRALALFTSQHEDWKVVFWSKIIEKIKRNQDAATFRELLAYEGVKKIGRSIVSSNAIGVNAGAAA